MLVIADTSPLSYLVRLGYVDMLIEVYGRVLVPSAVLTELRHPEAPPEVQTWAQSPPAWLEVVPVFRLDTTLPQELGSGEREAISLALESRADVLLIDERAGREQAEFRNIKVAGTLAVLLQASLRGHLQFPEAVEALRRYGFRASQPLVTAMLARYEQARKLIP